MILTSLRRWIRRSPVGQINQKRKDIQKGLEPRGGSDKFRIPCRPVRTRGASRERHRKDRNGDEDLEEEAIYRMRETVM